MYKFKKILIIQTAFIGDVILATPVVEKLKIFFPEAEVDFLVRKGNETLFKNNPNINRVLILDKSQKKYIHLAAVIKEIRKREYDLVVNLQRYATTGTITVLSGAKMTVGFSENPMSFLFTRKIAHGMSTKKKTKHEVERNLELIEEFTDDSMVRPKLYITEEDAKKIQAPEKYYCIAPNSVLKTKEYPQEKWVELIKELTSDAAVYILGAPGEMEKSRKLFEKVKNYNVQNLTGKLSFLESAALMKGAKMNFTNDSAPLHLASAVNAPVRALFLSTSPILGFTPLSENSMVIETKRELSCKPCGMTGKKECPEGHFMCSDISAKEILDTL
ncbi:MAG: glycosyltransferase family 9 protein [Chlorobi bacterium]|nr:glycosyltransferase family 9 protein [Chlorobiota bacterium]